LQGIGAIVGAVSKISNKCINRCVIKPGNKLSSTEETCLENCGARYQDMEEFLI
jgi:hypothetical protein